MFCKSTIANSELTSRVALSFPYGILLLDLRSLDPLLEQKCIVFRSLDPLWDFERLLFVATKAITVRNKECTKLQLTWSRLHAVHEIHHVVPITLVTQSAGIVPKLYDVDFLDYRFFLPE